MGKLGSNPLAGLAALGLGGLATPANTGGLNPAGMRRMHYFDVITRGHPRGINLFIYSAAGQATLPRPELVCE